MFNFFKKESASLRFSKSVGESTHIMEELLSEGRRASGEIEKLADGRIASRKDVESLQYHINILCKIHQESHDCLSSMKIFKEVQAAVQEAHDAIESSLIQLIRQIDEQQYNDWRKHVAEFKNSALEQEDRVKQQLRKIDN